MKRAEHNLFHAQRKTALLNAVSKDGPRGFILLQWKQALSGSLAFKRNMYCSVPCLPVATVMMHTHTNTKHANMYMHDDLARCDTLGSCLASAAVRWYWHVGGGPMIWPVAV